MQEHIRRAHPEHYIPKLPATEESFALMVNSAPHERPPPVVTTHPLSTVSVSVPAGPVGKSQPSPGVTSNPPAAPADYNPIYTNEYAFPPLTRTSGEFRRAPVHSTANSSDPLSQLLHGRTELPWEQDHVSRPASRPRLTVRATATTSTRTAWACTTAPNSTRQPTPRSS
jgi:hypothetical protein